MHGWIAAILNLLGMGGGGAVTSADPEIIDLIAYDTSVTDLFAYDVSITDLTAE